MSRFDLVIQTRDLGMSEVSLNSAGQESLSWVASTVDWDLEPGETNSEVIFAGPEGNEESIIMPEDDDPK